MKFKNVLHYVGLLSFFILTLLGWLFWKGKATAIAALIIATILLFVIYYLVRLMAQKREETHVNLIHIICLWSVYILIAFFGAFLSLHSITVLSLANQDLKDNGNAKLDALKELRNVFATSKADIKGELEVEVLNLLESYSQSVVQQERKTLRDKLINNYGFHSTFDENLNPRELRNTWIETNYDNKIDVFYKPIDKELLAYYTKHKNTFNDAKVLDMNTVYYELDSVLLKNKEKIKENFSNLINNYEIDQDPYKGYTLPESTVSLNSLSELRKQYNPLKYIAIYLFIHFLLLCPFLFTGKDVLKPLAQANDDETTLH